MLAGRTDLPFERDQSTRFLPWIVALMVFLGVLMFAGALVVAGTVQAWDSNLTGRMTVQVPDAVADDATTGRLLAMLRQTPGVTRAEVVPAETVAALLVPWLGEGAVESDLPVPALIDVELAPGARIDAARLSTRLAEAAPGTAVDDHRAWLSALIDLGRAVEALAFAILALIASAAVIAVVFTTRSGLAVHAAIIELLHQMGAHDRYIAGQFQLQAMMLAIRGGLAGAVAAAAVLVVIGWVASGVDAAFLPPLTLAPVEWIALLVVPVAAIAISMLTARITVLRALARMP